MTKRNPDTSRDTVPELRGRGRDSEWWSPERAARSQARKQIVISALGTCAMLSHTMAPVVGALTPTASNGVAALGAGGALAAILTPGDAQAQDKGAKGEKGEAGPTGPPGETGPAGPMRGSRGGSSGSDGRYWRPGLHWPEG